MLENYTDYLCNNQIILKSQQRFKSEHHDVYTVEINKIAQNAFKVCESEMMILRNLFVKYYANCWLYGENNITTTTKIRDYKCKYK